MKIRKLFSATIASLALGLSTSFAADTKVGFVYVGPINDGGWTQIHHENALVMKEYFGDQVEIYVIFFLLMLKILFNLEFQLVLHPKVQIINFN